MCGPRWPYPKAALIFIVLCFSLWLLLAWATPHVLAAVGEYLP